MATGGATEPAFYTLAGVALLGALIILFLPRTQLKAVPLKAA
jgi:LPXTG-motif cell wall-anchored protein